MRSKIGERRDNPAVNEWTVAATTELRPKWQKHSDRSIVREIDGLRPKKIVKRQLCHFETQTRKRRLAVEISRTGFSWSHRRHATTAFPRGTKRTGTGASLPSLT